MCGMGMGAVCTNPATDPAHCGNCNVACEQGDVCNNGMCSCPAGSTMCQNMGVNVCADTSNSPTHCGACGTACANDQACLSSACACRPGLTQCNGACTDLTADINNCGGCGVNCANNPMLMNPRCVSGVCQDTLCGALMPPRQFCNGACLTPAYQVCVAGACTAFFTSQACTTCPCPACGTGTTCCTYPGTMTDVVCVTGNTCPQ
jgi:hypothetical protein